MIKKILTLGTIAPAMLLANNIEVTLERNASNPNPLDIIVKATNTSDEDTFIETSDYPYKSGNVARNIFTVYEDGEELIYTGPIVSVASHPKKLTAGSTYITHVNIRKLYKLSQGTHSYEIRYENIDASNTLEIETTIAPRKRNQKEIAASHGCSANYMSILARDQTRAQLYAQNVINTLPRVASNHALYRQWFGYATSGRYNTVYENYKTISRGFNQNVTYNCVNPQCEEGWNAFVYQGQHNYNINICSAYWVNNTNTRPTTLLHEMSHITVHTLDGDGSGHYLHDDGAKRLANIRPNLAIRNAYSYGFYAKELFLKGGTGRKSGNSWTTGPYGNNVDTRRTLSVSKGRKVTVTVRGHLEQNYDFIYIYNRSGVVKRRLTGNINTSFTVSGKSIVARLVTDGSVTSSGVTVKIKRKRAWWEW